MELKIPEATLKQMHGDATKRPGEPIGSVTFYNTFAVRLINYVWALEAELATARQQLAETKDTFNTLVKVGAELGAERDQLKAQVEKLQALFVSAGSSRDAVARKIFAAAEGTMRTGEVWILADELIASRATLTSVRTEEGP